MSLDITFPHAPCSILSLDLMDVTGVFVTDIQGELTKRILDGNGRMIAKFPGIKKSSQVN